MANNNGIGRVNGGISISKKGGRENINMNNEGNTALCTNAWQ